MGEQSSPAVAVGTGESTLGRRVLRKVTWRLIPLLIAMYFVNYLDRTNIGLAGPGGMNEELGLTAQAFGFASGIFFLGYVFCEVPSNLALHRFGARKWLARILVSWGLIASLTAFVATDTWLFVLRFLLGVAEAGFFPGVILYLTFWFPKRVRAKATALFLLAVPLSSVIGAPVTAGLIQFGDALIEGFSGWRFMFLVEGLPAVLLGIVCWFYLTDKPADAKWLNQEERKWLIDRLASEDGETKRTYHYPLRKALLEPRVWALAVVYFGACYGIYAMNFFLPTIIQGFEESFDTDYSTIEVGLITAIPFVFGAIAMVLWSRHSDKTGERVWHVALPLFAGGLVIPVALFMDSPFTTMVVVTIFCICVFSALPAFWPLPTTFLVGASAAAGIALINSLSNTAGFLSPYITGWLADLTGSQNAGMFVLGGFMILAGAMVLILRAAPAPHLDPAAPTDIDNDADKEPTRI